MNAFVLHDTSDTNDALRWGTSATLIVAAHAALIALGMAWYTQRPPPGVSIPTIMIDMAPATASPQPTPMDIAPGPEMQEADASPPVEQAKPETVPEQLEATPPQLTPEVVAPPEAEAGPDAAETRAGQDRPGTSEAGTGAGEAEAGSQGSQEADRGPAGAAHHRAAPGRTAGAGSFRHQRGRQRGCGRVLQPDRRGASAALQATPACREGRRPAGHVAPALQPQPRRPGAVRPACGIVGPSRRSMPRRWRWSAAPSRFRRSRRI